MTETIAIVGGGISGTLTVLNCIKRSRKPLSIIWFDDQNNFCKGFAYSTIEANHLLNVRANNMSVFTDEPNHFVNWLEQHHQHYTAKDFVSRKIFGEYVESTFNNLKNTNPLVSIIQLPEQVISINKNNDGFEVKTKQSFKVQKLVLALGNFLPAHPKSVSKEFISSENYFQNAFHSRLIQHTLTKKNITIIGSGLTMIDIINSLSHHNYHGIINIISPHAYIPQPHQENPLPPVASFIETDKKYTLLELFALVNLQLKKAKKEYLNPHSVIDTMRPYLQSIWLNFSLTEKKQFFRHLRHKWGVARHRASGKSMSVFHQLILDNKIQIIKGRIFDIKTEGSSFKILFSNSAQTQQLESDLIINCTGPESDYTKITAPLIQELLKNQIIAPDLINYGINAQKDGQISQNLFTLGPPLKGILWESTAVPEIRVQAHDLASKIICN